MLTVNQTDFNLGKMKFGDVNKAYVPVINNTSVDIDVSSSGSSCSCTSGVMDINPIKPGQTANFIVTFKSGKAGRGLQSKSCNMNWKVGTQTYNKVIRIKADVS